MKSLNPKESCCTESTCHQGSCIGESPINTGGIRELIAHEHGLQIRRHFREVQSREHSIPDRGSRPENVPAQGPVSKSGDVVEIGVDVGSVQGRRGWRTCRPTGTPNHSRVVRVVLKSETSPMAVPPREAVARHAQDRHATGSRVIAISAFSLFPGGSQSLFKTLKSLSRHSRGKQPAKRLTVPKMASPHASNGCFILISER